MTTLFEQARQLLNKSDGSDLTPLLRNEILTAALSCHAHMHELGESDCREAASYAFLAAHLFRRVLTQPGQHPEWLKVHLEQCCRYGAIWTHNLLFTGEPIPAKWIEDALNMVDYLLEYHGNRLPWLEAIRTDLLQQATDSCSEFRATVVLVGNCQGYPLMLGVKQLLPSAKIYYSPPVHLATPADVRDLHGWISEADLLVCQRIAPGYRDDIGLDTQTLRSLMNPKARCLVIPSLYYDGCYPWIGYTYTGRDFATESAPESPLGDYHDFLAMAAAAQGLSCSELLDTPCSEAIGDLLRQANQDSLMQLRQREDDCDLKISDWIESEYRNRPLMHTVNHPTQATLDQLLRRIASCLENAIELSEQPFDAYEHLGLLRIPIHPWVVQALGLSEWTLQWGQRSGVAFDVEEQMNESIAFYKQNPIFAKANADHPKFRLAQRCLELRSASCDKMQPMVDLLHLHGFKCAGSTFIASLERACDGRVAYVESPQSNQRLAWQWLAAEQQSLPGDTRAITSHLITLPPPGSIARMKVAFLRDPLARIRSAYRFQRHVQRLTSHTSFVDYASSMTSNILANYQARHLSVQDLQGWKDYEGWKLDPGSIDLGREDLFVGLVELYDESMVILEHRLEKIGCQMDLAYPSASNTTHDFQGIDNSDFKLGQDIFNAICGVDLELYRRVETCLRQQIAELFDFDQRLQDFRRRCAHMRENNLRNYLKPNEEWIIVAPPDLVDCGAETKSAN